ncbi:MAG: DUF4349 domain-containing protein [Spirochaetales bacterium]|nr:DUF4349 domain-containing protein [Spirochaetales bacterium]
MVKKIYSVFFLVLAVFSGCASFGGGYKEAAGYPDYDEYETRDLAPAPLSMAKSSAPIAEETVAPMSMSVDTIAEAQSPPPEEPVRRLKVYSGFSRLIVEDPEETRNTIADLATDNGGYVEGIWGNLVVIRVPAEWFNELFQKILALGRVDYKNIETVDVTEYFTDLSTRLEIAERTRERLYTLLEKTEDVEERLKILREIRRLTEEIEGIRNTLASLEKMIAFSRIQVELVPRLAEDSGLRQTIPFPWIAGLHPLYPSLGAPVKKPELSLGEGFAVFSEDEVYRAEDPLGVRVRISGTVNQPVGDTAFWQEALAFHLSPLYAEAERVELQDGAIKGVLFTSKDKDPFYFLVAQEVVGDRIVVIEVFFPDARALEKMREPVFTALQGAVLR